ncbi:MAG TPA: Tol-Pal system beta propeller repeat protein TolB [Gammaproteobacteria bacterium]|nr:Tol-Pal system beta propeller repeat protein TolB [Gammaproteobacteria bacterium]
MTLRALILSFSAIILAALPVVAPQATLEIEITGGVNTASPIAIVPFVWQGQGAAPATDVADVIGADLTRSGRFKAIAAKDMLEKPTQASAINFDNWKVIGVNNLVIGRIKVTPNGGYAVEYQLFNVYTHQQLIGYSVATSAERLRYTAHFISDTIYQKLTGQRGAFTTRIAYVEHARSGAYSLIVADADGYGAQPIMQSPHQPIMSPSWSPDGRQIAYVSFESGQPAIYIQDLGTGKRDLVSQRAGLNGAPAFSPDGKSLALTLSSSPGNPDIYVMTLATKQLRRITTSEAIDTEPVWSPDGQSLYFTSDRGGTPQIYKVGAQGGEPQRVTFDGNYNADPKVSPDGKSIAFVHREDGNLHIAVMDLASGTLQTITDGELDKSPSFAPNGSMIIYAATSKNQGVLEEVSVDGQVHERLSERQGGVDVRAPVWGPFLTNGQ